MSFFVLPVNVSFVLNKSVVELSALKSVTVLSSAKAGSSSQYCHKIPHAFNNYHYILLNYTLVLAHQHHEHHQLAYC